MEKAAVAEKIQSVTRKIVREFKPEKIILFGSYAWGAPGPDSDVDLLVVKETSTPKRFRQRELRSKLFPPGMPLDILVYTPQEIEQRLAMGDLFVREVLQNGKKLYGRTK